MERDDNWIFPSIIIAGVAALWAAAFAYITGFQAKPTGAASLQIAFMIIVIVACWRVVPVVLNLWKAGVTNPISRLLEDLRPAFMASYPIAIGVIVLAIFLTSMSYLKSMIGSVVPFWADAPLAAVDSFIHVDPAALAVAFQPVIRPLGSFYGLWHVVHLGGILWVLHWRGGQKSRLIVAFMLTWAIGMVLAYIFSSAGPIFVGSYDPNLAPSSVQRAANFLWENYTNGTAVLGGGISAFPSMHVAIAAWFAIALKERGLLWLGILYLAGVFACSIILGWHYLLDSVAGVVIAIVADRLSCAWVRRHAASEANVLAV